MGKNSVPQLEAFLFTKDSTFALVKWPVRYSGTMNLCKASSGSLKHEKLQNLRLPSSRAHCSQGFPGEQGEHLVFEIWQAQQASASLTSRACFFSVAVRSLCRPRGSFVFVILDDLLKLN